jgi:type I restriction enzyme, R subunit
MSEAIGKVERVTQERVVRLFENELGYRFLGSWQERPRNSNVDENLVSEWLRGRGYSTQQIDRAIFELKSQAHSAQRSLYDNNEAVYSLLRYGIPVKVSAEENAETVHVIDWSNPYANNFAIAEEVTLVGDYDRRPDLVLYVNGIALGVIELKRSSVSIGEGIRQNLSNQQAQYHPWFFSTIQYVFAGNDSEGLRYGAILTPEKFWYTWKEDIHDNDGYKLDKYLHKMCEKSRFLEVIRDFVLFDAGRKKLPRPHQYFAIKAAQRRTAEEEGGIIWHTQGSGKSIVMVLLAKWLLENDPYARVIVITDRDELDKQIEGVFKGVGDEMRRTTSGRDLLSLLGNATPRLICSLVHKFGPQGESDFTTYLQKLKDTKVPTVGDFYVFVDEAHRSHSGKFNKALKTILPEAIFVGFTGTPLLKKDAESVKIFGSYIHTYKINEAVEDGVVLDLVYEAKDIDQCLSSPEKVDQYFAAKTKTLNPWQRSELEKCWATRQKVLGSKSRMERIVGDITLDFDLRPRLASGRGNAMLVASSIFEACRYFEYFQRTELRDRFAIVTSYNPNSKDTKLEETGANSETDRQYIYKTYEELLKNVLPRPGKTKTETYEDEVKEKFVKQPANMRLLVVVDKLLTGFDAPPCSVIYIDKHMQDHGLFQAICRTNRLDDDSKTAGVIVDYKRLFKKVQGTMEVYSSELDHSAPGASPEIAIQERVETLKDRVKDALEVLSYIMERVPRPQGDLECQRYFCGNTEIDTDLQETSHRREGLYRGVVSLVRAVAEISDDWDGTGYTQPEIDEIREKVDYNVKLRDFIRRSSGEELDLKPYEADMRRLIDMYVDADPSLDIFSTGDIGLLEMIDNLGADEIVQKIRKYANAENDSGYEIAAEMIENNVRKKIVASKFSDPVYYAKMSELLNEVIAERKAAAVEYHQYLNRVAELAKRVNDGRLDSTPSELDTPGKRALWNSLGQNKALGLDMHEAILANRPDAWRGNLSKEMEIKRTIHGVLSSNGVSFQSDEVESIFSIVREQPEYA